MYAFDQQEFNFEPCTKLTVHFINEDEIRHQWMMHGLPKYLYPKGMFHLEVSGPGKVSGTLILPPGDKTYLVHCDIAQHMEKGMKAQLKVGKGGEDLPSIPGVTASMFPDDYSGKPYVALPPPVASPAAASALQKEKADTTAKPVQTGTPSVISGLTVIGLALSLISAPMLEKKFKGMTTGEALANIFEIISHGIGSGFALLGKLFKMFSKNKPISLPDK